MSDLLFAPQDNTDLRRNFLYDIERKRGVLVDFGLAEVFCQHPSLVPGPSAMTNSEFSGREENFASARKLSKDDAIR